MSRPALGWPIALSALLALAGLALVAVLTDPTPVSPAEQAEALAAELRCPDCQGLSVADSPTQAAVEIRRQIASLLAEGRTPDEVRAHFVARYGDWILLAPQVPLYWAIPLIALVVGALLLAVWLRPVRRASSDGASRAVAGLDDADRRRIHDEAEAIDA
jgi:cytochrome c-type biogenesis protein CcmH